MPDFADRLRRMPDDTVTSLAFFSRLPVRSTASSFALHQSAGGWPISGLVVALGPAVLFVIARAADIPAVVAAILALALYAALTGGMHEDGLTDTFDGLGGGRTREDKLAIMRDSRLGSYGALALLFIFALKVSALAIIGVRPLHGAIALLAAAVISRTLALWHWNETMPARRDGMAWAAGRPDWMALSIGLAVAAIVAVIVLVVFGIAGLMGLVMAAAGVGLFSGLVNRQIGGHTGDTIGAAQQIGEAALLAGLSAGATYIVL
jgi:adenosylcobinamide-GDP ribazoletransferase